MILSFNNSSNKHYHISADGVVIEHSHPYSKSEQHTHTAEQLAKFSLFSSIFENFATTVVLPLVTYTEFEALVESDFNLEVVFITLSSNKSPPLL